MKKKLKLLDIYPEPLIYGIFSSMYKNSTLKEFFTSIKMNDPVSFDMEYFYKRSGLKTASTLLEYMVTNKIKISSYAKYEDDYVIDSNKYKVRAKTIMDKVNNDLINGLIIQKYLPIWEKMYDTFVTEFDPTKPYYQEMIEKSSDNLASNGTSENSGESSSNYTNTDTRETTNATTTDTSGTNSNNEYKFGYDDDSNDGSPYSRTSGNSSQDMTSNMTDNYEGTNTGNNSGNTSSSGKTTYSSDRNIDRTVDRQGNIGNTSITELLNQAIEYYKFTIFDRIYSDLDGILTRSKYITERC